MQANLVEYAPFWIRIPRSIAEFPKRVASEDSPPRKLCPQPVRGGSGRSEAIPFRQFAICIANQLPLVGSAALPLVLQMEIASPIFSSRDRKLTSYRVCNFLRFDLIVSCHRNSMPFATAASRRRCTRQISPVCPGNLRSYLLLELACSNDQCVRHPTRD